MINIDSYEMVLIALDDPVPPDVRVQAVLKAMLRNHKLRCISVRQNKVKRRSPTKAGLPPLDLNPAIKRCGLDSNFDDEG